MSSLLRPRPWLFWFGIPARVIHEMKLEDKARQRWMLPGTMDRHQEIQLLARLADTPPGCACGIAANDDKPAMEQAQPDGGGERRREKRITSNDLAWSADGTTLLHSASRALCPQIFDFEPMAEQHRQWQAFNGMPA